MTTAHRARATRAAAPRSARRELAKVPTGIVGLDDVLRGGLPAALLGNLSDTRQVLATLRLNGDGR